MAELLLELFSEEIPARMQNRAADDLKRLATDALKAAGLQFARADSYVTLRNQGLLGDRVFDIAPGTPAARVLHDGDTLRVGPSVDYDQIILRAECVKPGYPRIGFGECVGTVAAAR